MIARRIALLATFVLVLTPSQWAGAVPAPSAFPGAEGFGAHALGGRGGAVSVVTTLEDRDPASGPPPPGSLREALGTPGPRTIVFEVGGRIDLAVDLRVAHPFVTIAGQSAPGPGITVAGATLRIESTHDVVVRHLRCRAGDRRGPAGFAGDAITVSDGRDIIIDHCSASWSIDEALSVVGEGTDRVTVQWCFITEPLNDSWHPKGPHGYGSLDNGLANARISRHHNLYAHARSRSPRPGAGKEDPDATGLLYDFRNNLVYNWGDRAGYSAEHDDRVRMNYVGNWLAAGPSTGPGAEAIAFVATPGLRVYQADNRVNGVDAGWDAFAGSWQAAVRPFPVDAVATDPPDLACRRVLTEAGATRPCRDAVDLRIAAEAAAGTGRIIDSQEQVGGYPRLPTVRRSSRCDPDRDGMPSAWEREHGLDPHNPADGASDLDSDGWTNLEECLNTTDPRRPEE